MMPNTGLVRRHHQHVWHTFPDEGQWQRHSQYRLPSTEHGTVRALFCVFPEIEKHNQVLDSVIAVLVRGTVCLITGDRWMSFFVEREVPCNKENNT